MRHGSLFSGIGGFDLAAEWMGWENVFHCEWNEFGQKVLKHYWPKSISYADICSTDFTIHRGNIDIVTGGFPCQPYSAAGKRLGKEDDRHLWPEMLRAIREIQPRWIVGENVFGLVNWSDGLVFDEVQTDLETAGYEVFPYVLPAAAVGAPHRRDRIWFVAHAKLCSNRLSTAGRVDMERTVLERREWGKEADGFGIVSTDGNASDTLPIRLQQCEDYGEMGDRQGEICGTGGQLANGTEANGKVSDVADTNSDGFNQRNGKHEEQSSEGGQYALGNFNESNDDGNAADTGHTGLQGGAVFGGVGSSRAHGNKFSSGCVPPNWDKFPTQSPICSRNDGISDRLDGITFPKWRNESIKAAGNAIVPQVVFQIFKAIEQYEQLP